MNRPSQALHGTQNWQHLECLGWDTDGIGRSHSGATVSARCAVNGMFRVAIDLRALWGMHVSLVRLPENSTAGELLCRQDAQGDSAYVILKGKVSVFKVQISWWTKWLLFQFPQKKGDEPTLQRRSFLEDFPVERLVDSC